MIERILFRGAAWGVIAYIGAIQAVDLERQRVGSCISKDVKLHGLSAGAIILLLYAVGYNEQQMCELYETYTKRSRGNILTSSILNVTTLNMSLLEDVFKDHPDAFNKVNEANIRIGVTTKKGFRFIKNFTSNLQLANVMMCSLHIPCLSNFDANIDGDKALDGGIGFNALIFVESNRDKTFIIGANNPESHINFNMTTLFQMVPPPAFLHNHYLANAFNRTKDILCERSFCDDTVLKHINPLADPRNSIWWLIQDIRGVDITFDQLKSHIKDK